jgi:hypothetical protein
MSIVGPKNRANDKAQRIEAAFPSIASQSSRLSGIQAPFVAEVAASEIALTKCKSLALASGRVGLQATGCMSRRHSEMSTVASKKPFWKLDAFWFVGMPTILVGIVFLVALIARALGQ